VEERARGTTRKGGGSYSIGLSGTRVTRGKKEDTGCVPTHRVGVKGPKIPGGFS